MIVPLMKWQRKKRVVIFYLARDKRGQCECDEGGRTISQMQVDGVHTKMKDTTFGANNDILPGEKMFPIPCEMTQEYVFPMFDLIQ